MTTETITGALTPRRVLWCALVTVLAASAVHVAGTFSTLEHGGALPVLARMGPYVGVLAALAVDLGMIAMTWAVGARRRAGRDTWDLWIGVGVFAVLSALGNFDHALAVLGAGATGGAAWAALDWYTRVKVVLLSASLPLLAVWLTRVVETAVHDGQDSVTADTLGGQSTATPGEQDALLAALTRGSLLSWDTPGDTMPDVLPAAPALVHTNGHAAPAVVASTPAPRKASHSRTRAAVMPEDYRAYRDAAHRVLPGDGAPALEADRLVGAAVGKSAKAAQRDRLSQQPS